VRFLGVGDYCDLGDMYYRLAGSGHEVKVSIASPRTADVYGGMIDVTHDWQAELGWIRDAGKDGFVVFESATMGGLQDDLRRDGFQVIGGSSYGDRLEADREFGQAVLRDAGLCTAKSHRFTDFKRAIEFVRSSSVRFVLKSNGADSLRTRNYVGELEDGRDMIALLTLHAAQWRDNAAPDFVLMERVEGIEVGVGAYFNGEAFLQPACLDWEHKRFFAGDLGELTGEMGTIVTYEQSRRIFDRTLALIAHELRQSGYCGYINLNLIINEEGLWPLEFTSRFGYPGFAICESLHRESWADIFRKLASKTDLALLTNDGFAAGVVLTVPPFPYTHGYDELSKGAPILFRSDMNDEDMQGLHLAEVAMIDAQLVTSGMLGYVGVATGIGSTVEAASANAYRLARKVIVPNLRYRNDIGQRVCQGGLERLASLGYIG
jgi:phosphoribosylamine--glycine ligase